MVPQSFEHTGERAHAGAADADKIDIERLVTHFRGPRRGLCSGTVVPLAMGPS